MRSLLVLALMAATAWLAKQNAAVRSALACAYQQQLRPQIWAFSAILARDRMQEPLATKSVVGVLELLLVQAMLQSDVAER